MESVRTPGLVPLRDSDLVLTDESQDLRGRNAIGADGHEFGKVKSLLVDEAEEKVRFVEFETGGVFGIGTERRVVPIEAIIDISDEAVQVGATREHVQGSPPYDPEMTYNRRYFDDLRAYYDLPPH